MTNITKILRQLGRRPRLIVAIALVVLYATMVVGFVHGNGTVRQFTDTGTYFAAASSPLLSGKLWAGVRAPLAPLVFKTLHLEPSAIVLFQMIFSISAWSFLAVAVLFTTRSFLAGIAGASAILTYSVINNIAIWNNVILSESLGLSVLVSLLASWILYIQRRTTTSFCLVLLFGLAFALTRDTHGYVLALLGAALILVEALRFITRRRNVNRYHFLIACAYLAFFLLSATSHNIGERWVFPFYNIVSHRILPFPARTQFFQQRGMPVNDALSSRAGKWASSNNHAYYTDPELQDFRSWAQAKGKTTYIEFLLLHPEYLALEPLVPFMSILRMNHSAYIPDGFITSIPGRLWQQFVNTTSVTLLVFVAGLLFGGIIMVPLLRNGTLSIAAVGIALLAIPHYFIAFHGDAMEVPRHCLFAMVQFQLAFLIASIVIIDHLISSLQAAMYFHTNSAHKT